MAKKPTVPQIRVDASRELLGELHTAREALIRAERRKRAASSFPLIDHLIVSVMHARRKIDVVPDVLPLETPAPRNVQETPE